MGKKIEKEKRVNEVESLKEGSIIHLFITKKSEEESAQQNNTTRTNNSRVNSNRRENENSNNIERVDFQNAVFFSTIKTHCIIFIMFCFFIYQYKQDKEILNKAALILIQVLALLWASLVSKVVAKWMVFKTIIYDNQVENERNENNHYD